jgi:hypothetical protein
MSSISYMSNKKMSMGSYYPRSARTLPGLPSAANIPLPFIVAEYSSGPCHGQFLSQSLSKVANQPWFLPENQGEPSMQMHSVSIDICMIHKCPISRLLYFHVSIVQLALSRRPPRTALKNVP